VDIPYPFGVGGKCSHDEGFVITCNGSTPFLSDKNYQYRILNLSVVPNVALVELPISYECYHWPGSIRADSKTRTVEFDKKGVYRFSDTRNELVTIGCCMNGYIASNGTDGTSHKYSIFIGCISYCTSAESTVNGRCAGIGCCSVDIPPGLSDNSIAFGGYDHLGVHDFSPCSYGFLVGKDSYTFRQGDLQMDKNTMMPVWLDWAIRPPNGSKELTCAEAVKDRASYACKGLHITCKDAVNGTGPGYSCECADTATKAIPTSKATAGAPVSMRQKLITICMRI
jgi:hypothetical protein